MKVAVLLALATAAVADIINNEVASPPMARSWYNG